ncbi:MAG: hypothetical protein DRP55_07755 [Spirochaetes bacterium]|nr:MAG: hypothetical protein DRP55_07755 [Spirochaetota bacterium]
MLGTIFIIIGFLLFVCSFGVGTAGMTGYIEEHYPDKEEKIRNLVLLGLIFGFAIMIIGFYI